MRRARLIGIQGDLDLEKEVDLGEVIRRIVDEVADGLDADRATLYLIDRARGEVVSRAAHLPEIGEIRLRLGEASRDGWRRRGGS